jgi:cyclopropane fatty-acyl-phospholipid synthase-like methyltransferase
MHHDLREPRPQRQAWIDERRAAVVSAYNAEAAIYDCHPYPNRWQRAWVKRLVGLCPEEGTVLDAPCGTGKYFSLVAQFGRSVVGIDQSANMLAQAERRHIAVELHHIGLQEMSFVNEFDAVMTIDAMENIAPEDWPGVVTNLRRALRPGGHLYLTVEEEHPDVDLTAAWEALLARGLPAIRGEIVDGDVAGYHYYPQRDQVLDWIESAGLDLVDEVYHQEDGGWGYRHFLLRASPTHPSRRFSARDRRRHPLSPRPPQQQEP